MKIDEIIEKTVNETILKLKMSGLMKDDGRTPYERTEEILKTYSAIVESDQPTAKELSRKMGVILERLSDDYYYDVIRMMYFENQSREETAEYFDTSPTTISRNKRRLVEEITKSLFTDEVIEDLMRVKLVKDVQ